MKVVLQNLTKIFPSRNKKSNEEVVAVNDFTFEIPDGKLIGLLGPSGCGKSTTLYMICGLQKPTSGRIFFGDDDVTDLAPENRGVGLVFQNYALYPHMTVKQNILFPLQNLRGADKPTKEEMLERAYSAAQLVQIDELMDRKPSELSGGQQQRVAIARTLAPEPKVIFMDEPLSNLDAKLRLEMRSELQRLHLATGCTFVYVTHDQSEALAVSDRIAVMNAGHVLQVGTPFEIYESPATQFVAQFIGETNLFEATVVDCLPYKTAEGNSEYLETLSVPCLGQQAPLASDTAEETSLDRYMQVTDYEQTKPGQKVAVTIRPEKVRITLTPPETGGRTDINVYSGIVEEPIYSGFQSKFYVKLDSGAVIKVFKQHTDYMDQGPVIRWKDKVYVSWSADDAYVVEDIEK